MSEYGKAAFESRDNMARAKRNRSHGSTLLAGDTVAYTRLFLQSIADRSRASHQRRGTVLGPADTAAEWGHLAAPIDASTWLIEVQWSEGSISRINPANVCRIRSVPFIE